jgi:hypothetical protein
VDRKTKICIWVILIGLANFVAYCGLYVYFYGEAVNGRIEAAAGRQRYFLQSGREVSRAAFIYSGVHSISIWPTVAAIMLAMLTLAKDRITASMPAQRARARAMMTVMAVVIALVAALLTFEFTRTFLRRFEEATPPAPTTRPAPTPAA